MRVALAARDIGKLSDLVDETGAQAVHCDANQPTDVVQLFEQVDRALGVPDLVVYNASGRYRGPIEAIEPEKLDAALAP
jgi:NAD(P)-dependent dehydrogenase (short-subunit alcohol dehydrogenase family)